MTDDTNRDADADLHRYESAGVIVEWRPHLCQHSGRCVGALPAVFNPKRRPWIVADAATADEVVEAVNRCPSGALRSIRKPPPPVASKPDFG